MDKPELKKPTEITTAELQFFYENLKGELNPQNKVQDLGLAEITEMHMMPVFETISSRFEEAQTRSATQQRRTRERLEEFLRPVFSNLMAKGLLTKEELTAPPPPQPET